jgi:hypothetical protein
MAHESSVLPAALADASSLETRERVLVVAEVLLALGALFGAVGLMSGWIDLDQAVDDLPWQSPMIAGVSLGVVNGLLPLTVAAAAVRRRWWAPLGHVLVGIVLVGWIVVQIGFIGLGSWLQVAYALFGAAIAALAVSNLRTHDRSAHP